MRNQLRWLVMVVMMLLVKASYAGEHRWTQFGLRPLAMGNAFVAVVDDYNTLFYNPAGLARIKEWDGEFFNPAFEAATETLSTIGDVKDLATKGGQLTEVLDFLQKQSGKTHHMGLYLTPHLIFPNFGFGIGVDASVFMSIHRSIELEFKTDLPNIVAPMSYATSFLQDRLSVGVSLKTRFLTGVDQRIDIADIQKLSNNINDLLQMGLGVGIDTGVLFTPTYGDMEPTFGMSIMDLGGTSYQKLGAYAKPPSVPPTVNTGFSFKPINRDKMYILASVDTHMINRPVHFSHKLNFGLEWGYSSLIKVQTGLKSGYLTAGFQFDLGLLSARFAYYVVDHAPIVGSVKELVEKRIAAQLKLLI